MAFMSRFKEAAGKLTDKVLETSRAVNEHVGENKDRWKKQAVDALTTTTATTIVAAKSAVDTTRNLYISVRYSTEDLRDLQNQIEAQGGFYRELLKNSRVSDLIFLGGESLATLLAAGLIPDDIDEAYRAAYPNLAEEFSFEDRARALEGEQLLGLISGVKGKLFEQQYVNYLNDGNLPEGYTALIAGSATQPGWDIEIIGPNNEISSVLQAKATDSVSYVTDAISRYPGIDVVTTDEVYSHLVMSGISEGIVSGSITNADLVDYLDKSVDAAELSMNFAPPIFTLAFIAFTSYKDESLTLYEKAQSAGSRSGKAYLSFLVGGGVAAITNTWWLGVVGTVGSRYMSDAGLRKAELIESLKKVYRSNQEIIDRIRKASAAQQAI